MCPWNSRWKDNDNSTRANQDFESLVCAGDSRSSTPVRNDRPIESHTERLHVHDRAAWQHGTRSESICAYASTSLYLGPKTSWSPNGCRASDCVRILPSWWHVGSTVSFCVFLTC